MGWLDRLFRRPPKKQKILYSPDWWMSLFTQTGTNAYLSDAVQQALKCIVDEVKKSKVTHVISKDRDGIPVKSDIQTVLDDPNDLMTTSEFIEKTVWLLLLNYNAFIVPVYTEWTDGNGVFHRRLESLYPINPTQVEFKEDEKGVTYVKFGFSNGYNTDLLPYDQIIHIKYNYAVNPYMGGDSNGQPDHEALLKTLELNKMLLEGVARSMKASCAINAVVKYSTMMDDGKMEAAIRRFEQLISKNESGFIPMDLGAEFIPIEHKPALVDEATLKFIDEKILRNWGVPLCILKGDYSKEQYEAFYQKTIEPLIIAISQALTKKLFTRRERSFGNCIKLYPEALAFLSTAQTIEMINALSPTGALLENEKRTALGLPPLAELEGKRYMSLNWIDAENANTYQIGENSGEAKNKA